MLMSCTKQIYETPFMVVVKLNAAQEILDFDKAKQYIDIKAVFSKYPESVNPEKEWKELLRFQYTLGEDKKFTNSFNYSAYDISESVLGKTAKIEFIPSEMPNNRDSRIIYQLELRNNKWIVIGINYSKAEVLRVDE